MPSFDLIGAGTLRRAAACFLLAWCALPGQAHATSTSLHQSWLFHRDDSRQLTSADQVPPDGRTRVDLPHAARLEPRVPTAPWQGTAFYKRQLQLSLR